MAQMWQSGGSYTLSLRCSETYNWRMEAIWDMEGSSQRGLKNSVNCGNSKCLKSQNDFLCKVRDKWEKCVKSGFFMCR